MNTRQTGPVLFLVLILLNSPFNVSSYEIDEVVLTAENQDTVSIRPQASYTFYDMEPRLGGTDYSYYNLEYRFDINMSLSAGTVVGIDLYILSNLGTYDGFSGGYEVGLPVTIKDPFDLGHTRHYYPHEIKANEEFGGIMTLDLGINTKTEVESIKVRMEFDITSNQFTLGKNITFTHQIDFDVYSDRPFVSFNFLFSLSLTMLIVINVRWRKLDKDK